MRFKNRKRGTVFAALLTISSHAFPSGLTYVNDQINYLFPEPTVSRWLATFSIGTIWENAGNNHQTVSLNPGQENTYAGNNSTHTLANAEIFLGIQNFISETLPVQTGLAFATTGSADITGNIWLNGNPAATNYTYNYKIRHSHIVLKGKLLFDNGYFLTPWVSVSAGVGFNQSRDFVNHPTVTGAAAMPDFSNNTTTAFTYALGVGVKHNLTPHWQIGAGYEFADWGKSQLGTTDTQTTGHGLSIQDIYTNGLLFNVTYIG